MDATVGLYLWPMRLTREAVLLAAGGLWCWWVFGRFSVHGAVLETSKSVASKAVVILLWLATLCVLVAMARVVWGILANVSEVFG